MNPGDEGARGESGKSEECAIWIILCGEDSEEGVDEVRERYVFKMDFALVSKEGLLRAGPQWLGCSNPSWMSIRRRADLWVFVGDDIGVMGL